MKKIKLLTSLSTLPILGMACIPLTSCKANIGQYTVVNCSSSTVTFTDLKESWKQGDGDITATYTYDTTSLKFDELNSDVLIDSKSIKSEEGVVYKDGKITIPESLITGNVTIKITVADKASYTITNSSSEGVTITGLNEKWHEGDGDISATYTITDTNVQFDERNCDILVGNISIISLDGVVYKNGKIKIPSKYIIGNITIKIQTCINPGEIDTSLSDIVSACDEYESTSRSKESQNEFAEKFTINGNQVKSVTSLIGSTFKITINGKEHIVRIIDLDHDEMYNETTKLTLGKAALTCELETSLSNTNGNAMKSAWSSQYNNDYTNSILRWNLNGTGTEPSSGSKWSSTAFDLIKTGNPTLKTGIKTVQKTVARDSESGGTDFVVTGYSDKLFPLSYTEIGGTDRSEAKVEGSVYKYWESLRGYKNYRIKKDCNGNVVNYWLRSPYAHSYLPYNEYSYYIDDDGDLMYVEDYSVTDSIAPSIAFCI